MHTNSEFRGSYTESPFLYQQFNIRQIRTLRVGQPNVGFDAANNCRLFVTTMKALNFQDVILSIASDNFKIHHGLPLDLTSIQNATENFHFPELVGEPLRLELNFTSPLEQVTELIVLGERLSSVAVDKFGLAGIYLKKRILFLSSNYSTKSHSSSIGTVAPFPLTMFQLLIMVLLPL